MSLYMRVGVWNVLALRKIYSQIETLNCKTAPADTFWLVYYSHPQTHSQLDTLTHFRFISLRTAVETRGPGLFIRSDRKLVSNWVLFHNTDCTLGIEHQRFARRFRIAHRQISRCCGCYQRRVRFWVLLMRLSSLFDISAYSAHVL